MKTRFIVAYSAVLLLAFVMIGCGGGGNESSITTTPLSEAQISKENYKGKAASVVFQDDFNDTTFTDGWVNPEITGNYIVHQSSGLLRMFGDATQNTCDPDGCEGGAILASRTLADASAPIQVQINTDIGNSVVPQSSIAQGAIGLLDGANQFVAFGLVKGDSPCNQACLFYIDSSIQGPPTILATGVSDSGILSINYSNGSYTLALDSSQYNVSGPILSGGVQMGLFGRTRYLLTGPAVDPADVHLQVDFDNASLKGTFFTTCDTSLTSQKLIGVRASVEALIAEIDAAGIRRGFIPQIGNLLGQLNRAIFLLQQGQYQESLNALRSLIGILKEASGGISSQRGNVIPPSLAQKWLNDIANIQAEIDRIILETKVCI